MRTKVINFIAAPGVGKSTCAALLYGELKARHITCEVIPEYAKWLVYKGETEELNNQYQVSKQQYNLIKTVEGKVQYAICDSLVMGLYYNKMYVDNVSNVKKTEEMILSKINEFDNIFIFLERNHEHPYEMNGRVHSEFESTQIQFKMKELVQRLGFECLYVVSDKASVPKMIKYIYEKTRDQRLK
jgi:tRNA uridine 5-carbamoylmethylation protein Kti12